MRSPSPGLGGASPPRGASPVPAGSSGTTTPLLSRAPTPTLYHPSRVLDSRVRHKLTLERVNFRWRHAYLSDLYHTLINCPWYRFFTAFIVCYMSMYCAFALLYWSQDGCVTLTTNFWHALWFSVTTSATIGYGHQAPDPDCYLLQWGITAQVLISLVFEASLLGLLFARISSSSGRSATIRFSQALSMYRGEDGVYRLAFRVANLRQHQVLSPKVRLLLLRQQQVHPFSSGSWEYVYSECHVTHIGGGQLWLGVPSVIEHRIDQRSPLWGWAEADIMAADMEFIVLLSGLDESTSRAMEARHSYVPADIRWQQQFDACIQRGRSGKLGVDFACFDSTKPRVPSAATLNAGMTPSPSESGAACGYAGAGHSSHYFSGAASNGSMAAAAAAAEGADAAAAAEAGLAPPIAIDGQQLLSTSPFAAFASNGRTSRFQ